MTNLVLDYAENQCNNFENLKENHFQTDIFTDETSDPDTNFYNKNLQVLDWKYCSVEEKTEKKN